MSPSDPDRTRSSSSSSSGRLLIALAAAGVGALALLSVALFLGLKSEPRVPSETPAPRASAAPVPEWAATEGLVLPAEVEQVIDAGKQVQAAFAPEAETVDLFSGPAPELIWRGHEIVERGGRLHSKRVKQLYELGKTSPGDARPHILLALDSMNRGWYAFAVGHYRRAVTENPEAAKDPRMMKDLLEMAGRDHHAEKARSAILDIYGAGALPAARAALEEATAEGNEKRAAHLRELIGSLEPTGQ